VMLSTLIWIVFHNEYHLRFTPSALTSGQSQLEEIESLISNSAFGIVCLDGLRMSSTSTDTCGDAAYLQFF
jgi:hypothetical protein